MKQQLENMMYDSLENQEEVKVYQVGDLESLSATVLYTDHLPKMGFGGFKPLKKNSYLDKPSLDIENSNTFKPIEIKPINIVLPKVEPVKIGTLSEFQKEGPDNISIKYDLSQYSPEAKKFSLTERYDASNHNDSLFHLNLDVTNINSGKSKKNEDGYKGLGSVHNIKLFNIDE